MATVDVIEFGGNVEDVVWKYPAKDFSTLSQLIVNESQEALLYRDGKAYDLFGAGRYTLNTENIPLFSQMFKMQAGEKLPFQCEIYFVNRTEKMAIKWGTRPMSYLDPTCNNYSFQISAYGEMSLNISDSRKLIVKLVGQQQKLDLETIRNYFKVPINMHICSMLPKYLRERSIPIYLVDNYLLEISEYLQSRISVEMNDYGISLEKFWVEEIRKPENDPVYREVNRQRGMQVTMLTQGNLNLQQANLKAQEDMVRYTTKIQMDKMEADLKAYTNQVLGVTEKERMKTEVLLHVADNPGSGSTVQNAMIGAGVGMATAGIMNQAIGTYAQDVFSDGQVLQTPFSNNTSLGNMPNPIQLKEDESAISPEKQEEDDEIIRKKLRKLKIAWEEGHFTDEEYKARREQLLS